MRKTFLIIIATVLTVATVIFPNDLFPAVIGVYSESQLNSALNNSKNGDTIIVMQAIYLTRDLNTVSNKSITIMGNPNDLSFQGVPISGYINGENKFKLLNFENCEKITIQNLRLWNGLNFAISINNCDSIIFKNVHIKGIRSATNNLNVHGVNIIANKFVSMNEVFVSECDGYSGFGDNTGGPISGPVIGLFITVPKLIMDSVISQNHKGGMGGIYGSGKECKGIFIKDVQNGILSRIISYNNSAGSSAEYPAPCIGIHLENSNIIMENIIISDNKVGNNAQGVQGMLAGLFIKNSNVIVNRVTVKNHSSNHTSWTRNAAGIHIANSNNNILIANSSIFYNNWNGIKIGGYSDNSGSSTYNNKIFLINSTIGENKNGGIAWNRPNNNSTVSTSIYNSIVHNTETSDLIIPSDNDSFYIILKNSVYSNFSDYEKLVMQNCEKQNPFFTPYKANDSVWTGSNAFDIAYLKPQNSSLSRLADKVFFSTDTINNFFEDNEFIKAHLTPSKLDSFLRYDARKQLRKIDDYGRYAPGSIDFSTTNILDDVILSVNISPNPAQTHLTIHHSKEIGNIGLYDLSGRLLRTYSGTGIITILDISDLDNGVYFITVAGKTVKFIKE